MHDLTLIGVHEDGQHLLLADGSGMRYRLALDEALRAAARRDRPRLGQLQIEIEGGLRPREVQALIRAGRSAQEVADRAGWTVEKVRRFEGPILAEREHIARRARVTSVARDGSAHPTLDERASDRFRARGVDLQDTEWDSHRQDSGQWIVTVSFPAGGRQRSAAWKFDLVTGALRAQNDDARWLGEDDQIGSIPVPHVADADRPGDAVFDVMASTSGSATVRARQRSVAPTMPATPAGGSTTEDELTSSIRAHHSLIRDRRGRRRHHAAEVPGASTSPTDALPLEPLALDLDSVEPPPARPREESAAQPGAPRSAAPGSPGHGADQGRTPSPAAAPEVPAGDAPTHSPPEGPMVRRGRARVPAWQDVVLGARTRTPDAESDPGGDSERGSGSASGSGSGSDQHAG